MFNILLEQNKTTDTQRVKIRRSILLLNRSFSSLKVLNQVRLSQGTILVLWRMKVRRTTYLRGQADVGEYLSQCPHHLLSPLQMFWSFPSQYDPSVDGTVLPDSLENGLVKDQTKRRTHYNTHIRSHTSVTQIEYFFCKINIFQSTNVNFLPALARVWSSSNVC